MEHGEFGALGKGGQLKNSSLAVLEQSLLCACKQCRVSCDDVA